VNGWLQIDGDLFALPARSANEDGSYLWLRAGELAEAVEAELFLPAVDPGALNLAMGVATGTVEVDGQHRTGEVQMQFGRVSEGRGVMSLGGDLLDADVRFGLHHSPPDGGFCPYCGGRLEVETVRVILPPDGGVIGELVARCTGCGRS
jgi:hypothetical protein